MTLLLENTALISHAHRELFGSFESTNLCRDSLSGETNWVSIGLEGTKGVPRKGGRK